MGFLHKLWDETLAGPAPDSGLGKLRKYNSLSAARSTPSVDIPNNISRTITVRRPSELSVVGSGSAPSSPAGSTPPASPFSPMAPGGDVKRLTRRKSTSAAMQRGSPKSPTGYDWIVLSALDR